MNILSELFITFAKIGAFSFGGGYGMIKMLEEECIDKHAWINHDDLNNIIVIAEATPGSVAINCATYVGKKKAELIGALIATLGVILPSFVIIFSISLFMNDFLQLAWVQNAFKGIQIAVCILIFKAAISMIKKIKFESINWLLFGFSLLFMLAINFLSWNFSTLYIIFIAAVLSLSVFAVKDLLNSQTTLEKEKFENKNESLQVSRNSDSDGVERD